MSFPRYPKYKDSGVAWLGQVPDGWTPLPLKHVASLKGRLGWQGLRADEYTDDGPFLVTSEHFERDSVAWHRCYHVSEDRYAIAPEIQLRSNDLLMMKDGAAMGKLAYVETLPGPACLNSHLLLFRPKDGRFINRYLYYVLASPTFDTYMLRERRGSTFFGISQESIGAFPLVLPPLPEQTAIAAFLDRETAKIDALVAEQERLIELLKEKRQAVISHTVTKGLNPDAPMKDSGVEWLGEIPAHWEVSPLKYSITRIEQGWSPQCESYPAQDGEWGVLKVGCGNGDTFDPSEQKALPSDVPPEPRYEIQAGDILMSRGNTQDLVGAATLIEKPYDRLLISDLLYRFRSNPERALAQYLVLSLRSCHGRFQIERTATGTSASMKKIGQGDIRNFVLPLPPLSEQATICTFSRQCSSRLNSLIAQAQRAIELLQERRTALISAAVTGQIDVRDVERRAA